MFLIIFAFLAKAEVLIFFPTPVDYSAVNVITCLEMSDTSFIGNVWKEN